MREWITQIDVSGSMIEYKVIDTESSIIVQPVNIQDLAKVAPNGTHMRFDENWELVIAPYTPTILPEVDTFLEEEEMVKRHKTVI